MQRIAQTGFHALSRTLASMSLTSDELPERDLDLYDSDLDFCTGFGVDTGLPEVLVSGSGSQGRVVLPQVVVKGILCPPQGNL